ncbi:MAG TPA: sodium:solute symporter family protein [Vicinamibacterales bacterium]|jgi:Na+/proline symporter|nr:sodium:solute symporter family protein [Vicinamibacterales bacterium]
MTLTAFDWSVIAAYFLFNLGIGIYYARRAGRSTQEFFLSGRDVPWWLAGTSMVATTFAADTPLVVTGLVASYGIAGNWLWWSMAMSGIMTVFLYARLWRRAGVMTDVEFAEVRYSGRPAAVLRGFRALYLGIPINCIVLGWVNLAMLKILMATLGLDRDAALLVLLGILAFTAFYTTISGLWGVLVTDLFQFVLKMAMVILLAVLAVRAVGGIDALQMKIASLDAARGVGSRLTFFPARGSAWMPAITFFVYLAVNWWASWYPGAEPGGGGYVAQRIFSAKDERQGVLATLWFNVAHYALRPWPWILTALATIVLYPNLVDKESGYIKALVDPAVFPPALRGFMLAAFAAAYMSTIGTQLNWGASYIINDWYRRFVKRGATERHYIVASQLCTVGLTAISIFVTLHLDTIGGAWKLLLVTGAGTGTVLLLRWYWWRINAWSEVSAMIAAAMVSLTLQTRWHWNSDDPEQFAWLMLVTVGLTTIAWVFVTFATAPEPMETLVAFYRRVRPAGPGWAPVAAVAGVPPIRESLIRSLAAWVLGCVLIYALLFGIGSLILGPRLVGMGLIVAALAAGALIFKVFEPEPEAGAYGSVL